MVSRRNFLGGVSAASVTCLVKDSLALPAFHSLLGAPSGAGADTDNTKLVKIAIGTGAWSYIPGRNDAIWRSATGPGHGHKRLGPLFGIPLRRWFDTGFQPYASERYGMHRHVGCSANAGNR